MQLWRAVTSSFLDVLLPRRCVHCDRAGAWLCHRCLAAVHWMTPPLCDSCGREIGAGSRCQECARDQPAIDGIRACARYEGVIRLAVHRLKYGGHRALAEPLADFLANTAHGLPPADVIVPLPLHAARLRRRGYNQAELLSRHLGRRLALPVLPLVRRVRETRDQIGLSRAERRANVGGAFACPTPRRAAGRRILLVDDVCTTGSTLVACAAPLRHAGAAAVWGLVVARQDYERT